MRFDRKGIEKYESRLGWAIGENINFWLGTYKYVLYVQRNLIIFCTLVFNSLNSTFSNKINNIIFLVFNRLNYFNSIDVYVFQPILQEIKNV